jgi:hypothetical protein
MFVSKEVFEVRLLARFLESIDQASVAERLEPGSGPDFSVRLSTGVVGVEITRVYRKDLERGVAFRQAEGLWDQVRAGAHLEWSRLRLPDVTVYVRTIPGVVPQKSEVPRLVSQLVTFVSTRIPDVNENANYERVWSSLAPSTLPEGVAAIDLSRPSYHDTTYWFMPRSTMVPDLMPDLLQEKIDRKNSKLRRYTAAPKENWLVLVIEGSAPSSTFTITQGALEHSYRSEFKRTWLFDAFARRSVELRTFRPPEAAA